MPDVDYDELSKSHLIALLYRHQRFLEEQQETLVQQRGQVTRLMDALEEKDRLLRELARVVVATNGQRAGIGDNAHR